MFFEVKKVQDVACKLGVVFVSAGFIGFFLESSISAFHGISAMLLGVGFIVFGVLRRGNGEGGQDE